jgi:hypothetical protein
MIDEKAKEEEEINNENLEAFTAAIDRLVPFYKTKGFNSTAIIIEGETGFPNPTLRRNAEKVAILNAQIAAGASIAASEFDRAYGRVRGRRPRVSAEVAQKLQVAIDHNAAVGDAVKKASSTKSVYLSKGLFDGTVQGSHRQVLERLVKNENKARYPAGDIPSHLLAPISATVLNETMNRTTKPKALTADYSTKRRVQARKDLGNVISLAASLAFLHRWAPGLGVPQDTIADELCYNYDESSCYRNGVDKLEVFVGENTSSEMRASNSSVKTSKVGEPADGGYGNNNRCYGYATLTKMSGELTLFLQIVKDKCYKNKEIVTASVSTSTLSQDALVFLRPS